MFSFLFRRKSSNSVLIKTIVICQNFNYIATKETKKGWPLLTVETEANGYSRSKGVLPSLVCWARCASTRDFGPALAALVGPVQNSFFLAVHYLFHFICPLFPSKLDRQSCRVACLLICFSDCNSYNSGEPQLCMYGTRQGGFLY
jgi:hypothetical protein